MDPGSMLKVTITPMIGSSVLSKVRLLIQSNVGGKGFGLLNSCNQIITLYFSIFKNKKTTVNMYVKLNNADYDKLNQSDGGKEHKNIPTSKCCNELVLLL
jgi:hypothetical protein